MLKFINNNKKVHGLVQYKEGPRGRLLGLLGLKPFTMTKVGLRPTELTEAQWPKVLNSNLKSSTTLPVTGFSQNYMILNFNYKYPQNLNIFNAQ